MSIILKGIDLPKEGEHIVAIIKSNGKCTCWKQDTEYGICESMQTAEATQIPTPHGRLIDASELIKSYMKGTKTDIDDFYDTIDIMDNAPTILEAEE